MIAAAHRAQADALEIEAQAKRRLADEYDAAQERGELRTRASNLHASSHAEEAPPPRTDQQQADTDTVQRLFADERITRDDANARIAKIDPHWAQRAAGVGDIGLTHKQIHDAREVRDAEAADPGVCGCDLGRAGPQVTCIVNARRV